MTTIYKCSVPLTTPQKQGKEKTLKVHNHPLNAEYYYKNVNGEDKFICTNKKEIKKWLTCAKEKGQCGRLTYHPGKKGWIKYFDIPAYYTYETKWGDTAESVREMFSLKKGALMKHDRIYSLTEPYQGKIIKFNEEDIMQ